MKPNRDIVTPYLVFVFVVVALSGIIMFFHIADDYTTVVHEFLGLTFAAFAILHIVTNWNGIRGYAKRQKLVTPAIVILIVSTSFVVGGKIHGNIERDILLRFVKSPAKDSFRILGVDYLQGKEILIRNNITMKDSLESIAKVSEANNISPEDLVELIVSAKSSGD